MIKTRNDARVHLVRNVSIIILLLLAFQYILGMVSNLFVVFPTKVVSVNPLDSVFTNGPYLLLAHIVNGLALGLLSISAVVVSAIIGSKRLFVIAVCGLGSILFAGESGIEFVLGWYVNNVFSFLMSLGFMLSFVAYFVMFWYTNQGRVGSSG